MKISGFKNRRVSTQDDNSILSYDVDMSVDNLTGTAKFGVSGFVGASNNASNSRSLAFTLKSGRVFDPENRCVYSYQKDKDVNFKGTFLTTTYDYFIDNELICSKGSKANFKIRNFFFETDGVSIDLKDLDIYGKKGSITLSDSLNVDVYPSSGSSGSSGGYGSSGPFAGDTMTFSNALTFTSNDGFKASILSGQVTANDNMFGFDNSSTNINSLADVNGDSTTKDLKLKAITDIPIGNHPFGLDLFTSFGKTSLKSTVFAKKGENASGIQLSIQPPEQEQFLEGRIYSSMEVEGTFVDGQVIDGGKSPIDISGVFNLNYNAESVNEPELTNGLPFKLYLEHVEGDHSTQYSLISGVSLSGSGIGYDPGGIERKITFRTGEQGTYGTAGTAGINGATFGNAVDDEFVGLVSRSSTNESKLVETYASEIVTNMYDSSSTAGIAGASSLQGGVKGKFYKTNDGYLLLQRQNTPDIVTIIPDADGDSISYPTKEKASGVPVLYDYTKQVSDWKIFVGTNADDMAEVATGKNDAPYNYYTDYLTAGTMPRVAVKAKNYLDNTGAMVYDLVVSGADGFIAKKRLQQGGAQFITSRIYPLQATL